MSNGAVKLKFFDEIEWDNGKPKVLIVNPLSDEESESMSNIISRLENVVKVDFSYYDFNIKDSLSYLFSDVKYYAYQISNDEEGILKKFIDRQDKKYSTWVEHGSLLPISDFLKEFSKMFRDVVGVYPWLILSNVDVETEKRSIVGAIVFEMITSDVSGQVILTCKKSSWEDFDKGLDIFKRISSRLRSSKIELGV